jgi:hypothetical protein
MALSYTTRTRTVRTAAGILGFFHVSAPLGNTGPTYMLLRPCADTGHYTALVGGVGITPGGAWYVLNDARVQSRQQPDANDEAIAMNASQLCYQLV